MMVIVALYGGAQAFFDPASDAILPELLPECAARAGQRARAGRATARAAPRRAGGRRRARRRARPGLGLPRRRSDVRRLGRDAVVDVARAGGRSRPRHGTARTPRGRRAARGLRLRAPPRLAVGNLRERRASPTCCSWDPPRCCCRSWSSTSSAAAACSSASCSGAGGLGSVACALAMARSGLPSRSITFIYAVWALATLAVAGYGLATAIWQLMLASLAFNLLETAGTIVWATIKQRHVPGHMLGTRLEPRLADLDRAAAGVVRPDRPTQRRARGARDADRGGPRRRRGDARRPAAAGHARRRPHADATRDAARSRRPLLGGRDDVSVPSESEIEVRRLLVAEDFSCGR